jgi:hypothetical protein
VRWKTALLYAGPLVALLLVFIVLPLARGTETLILRDVLNSHMPMKWSQALALRDGYFPLIDPYRAGGQPLAGNLNAVPFYPDNLLYLVGTPFWGLNAHFWLHLLLAPFTFYWMARSWGLAREPAWASAVCYTVSGFFLSHLNFYNLIAGAALAPALIAACLDFANPALSRRRRALAAPAVALLWTLLILAGDPQTGLLAFALAMAALALVWKERFQGWAWRPLLPLAASFAVGTLIALPQIVEFLRILPLSFRGHYGYSGQNATISSWDPRQAAEWLLPLVFGRPDLLEKGGFWGGEFYTGVPPYYFSLYPGLLALALLAASGRPRGRAAWWAWGGIGAAIFISLGRFNPVAAWLFTLPGLKSLRYPIKFWLPVAVGAALLCGIGFAKLLADQPGGSVRRRFRRTLALLALAFAVFWAFLTFFPGPALAWMDLFIPRPPAFLANERLRWAGLCLISLALLGLLGVALRLLRRFPALGGALLLGAHALAQLFLLRPLYPTDPVKPYLVPPPALAHVPADLAVTNPDYNYLFGPSTLRQGNFPEPHHRWMERRSFFELYPFTAPIWGRRYELNVSPEGLDTFLTRMSQGAVKRADNAARLRLLAAWGIGRLLLNHPLDPLPPHARLLATVPSFGQTLYIYEVTGRAPEVFLARRVFEGPHLQAVFDRLTGPDFDPATDAVIFGDDPGPRLRGGGTARIVKRAPEFFEIEAQAGPGGSLLVLQRANLLYQATLDGRPTPVLTANAHRIGVEVPPGRHTLRLTIDRRPLYRSLAGAAVGLLLLPALAWWGGRALREKNPGEAIQPLDNPPASPL